MVRLGYDWVVHTFSDVVVDARDAAEAKRLAWARSREDPGFWCDAVECDGEAGATDVLSVERQRAKVDAESAPE